MSITRDADYPAERAQLFASLASYFDGHDMPTVLDVLANLLIAGMGQHAKGGGLTVDEAEAYAQATCDNIVAGIRSNWNGPPVDSVAVAAN